MPIQNIAPQTAGPRADDASQPQTGETWRAFRITMLSEALGRDTVDVVVLDVLPDIGDGLPGYRVRLPGEAEIILGRPWFVQRLTANPNRSL